VTLSDYRNTLSWKGAIELGPKLIRVAEELPASEEIGLSLQLRQLMVELPAAIAADMAGATDTRQLTMYKLVAALELVDRVYPALDTGDTKTAVDKLAERLAGPNFAEGATSSATPAPAAEPALTPEPNHEPEPEAPAVSVPAEPTPAAEPAAAPAVEATHVAVQPAVETPVASAPEGTNVHPDSSQQTQ
jgi:hypothetical protein